MKDIKNIRDVKNMKNVKDIKDVKNNKSGQRRKIHKKQIFIFHNKNTYQLNLIL